MLWTYAEPDGDNGYRRVGGGRYDPATDHYGQGAFNADDISRAAVVYLRHWVATGRDDSRLAAYQMLRGLAYLQTVTGPNAGNVVLWMQADGTLNPSADPHEDPDPSDSAESCWLARTVWALGEGYAAFQNVDEEFAAFLQDRFALCLAALRRQTLTRYGEWLHVDGADTPAWLIHDRTGLTAEALLGLAAFVEATGDADARTALDQFADGVAAMGAGTPRSWPFGAVLPAADAPGVWYGWGGLAPAALARAYRVTRSKAARDAALADAAAFTPHLLVAGSLDNSWEPAPTDCVQIAYSAQSRVESLLTVAACTDRPGLVALAGIAASWFFGNNPAGQAMYDPASGRTYDGIDVPGVVHKNAGAESTIHGLLAMLALDSNPQAAAIARTASVCDRHSWTVVAANHGAGARLVPGQRMRLRVPDGYRNVLMPVVELAPGAGATRWMAGNQVAGTVQHGLDNGHAPDNGSGVLAVRTLDAPIGSGELTVTGCDDAAAAVSGVLVQPEIEWVTLAEPDTPHGTGLLRSFAKSYRHAALAVPGTGEATVEAFDSTGYLRQRTTLPDEVVTVAVPPGGFAIVRR
jgi:hypothetical protein